MWKKAEKKSQHRIEVIMNEGYVLMQEQNWKLAGTLYDFVTNEQGTLVEDKIISKVNFWQCMKWSNQFNKIKDEVAEADFSAYNRKFQLSLLALKNDNDKFFELLEKALPHDITVDDLKKWPIFSEIRETEEYKKLIQTIEEPPLEVEFTDILKKIETYEEQVQELAAKDEDKKDEN